MRVWAPLWIGPLAWFASLLASFASARHACAADSKSVLFVIPLAALVSCLIAVSVCRRNSKPSAAGAAETPGASAESFRKLAATGLLLNGFFAVVILAQFVAPAFLGVCQ
jgi:hypothetical protein